MSTLFRYLGATSSQILKIIRQQKDKKVEKLKRYSINGEGFTYIREDINGVYVKFSDIMEESSSVTKTDNLKLPTLEEVHSYVHKVLSDGEGYDDWQRISVITAYKFICQHMKKE
jgi:hypothetical protein